MAASIAPAAPVKKERAPVADDQLVELKALLKRAQEAQRLYSTFSQEQVNFYAV